MGGLKHTLKKAYKKVKHATGLSGHDLSAIALSPFTAGASLATTSSARAMLSNPGGTINGALAGLETGGPLGAFLGAMQGGGGFDAMFNHGSTSAKSAADSAIAEQYKYNLALQQQNQQWQTAMSNTAHQRETVDLKAAGLNPVLSAGGSGASTGSGGPTSVGMPDKVAEKTAEMQNKIAKATLANEMANSASQRALNNAETARTVADIANQTAYTKANIQNLLAHTKYLKTENENAGTKTAAMQNAEDFANTWWGRNISPILADFGQIFGGAGAAANAAAGVSNARTARELAHGATETAIFNAKGVQTGTKRVTKLKK